MEKPQPVLETESPGPTALRKGFTLIELLAVISIIALLLSLILPAVQSARQAARRTQCLNNCHNWGIGLLNFAGGSASSQFPASGTWGDYQHDATNLWVNNANPAKLRSWVVDVLPFIDRIDIADRWQGDRKHDSVVQKNGFSNLSVMRGFNIEVLTCPDDPTANGVSGALSYVVNSGYASINLSLTNSSGWGAARQQSENKLLFDWDKNGRSAVSSAADKNDIAINHRSGVFWPETVNRQGAPKPDRVANRSHSPDSISDGMSNTLLLTENINAAGGQHWGDPDARYVVFVLPVDYTATEYTAANYYRVAPLDPRHPYGLINRARTGPEGSRPFPNSHHRGGVNAAYCDGSARFLSETVDANVYAQLITPAGTTLSNLIRAQEPLSSDAF